MQKYILLAMCLSFHPLIAQQEEDPFTQLIWSEEFTEAGSNWKQSNNSEEVFLIQDGSYLLWRKNSSSPAIVMPEKGEDFSASATRVQLTIDSENAAAGFFFQSRKDGKYALLFECNGRGEYRLRKLTGASFKNLSGKEGSDGWVKHQALKKSGVANVLAAVCNNGQVALLANDKPVVSFTEDPEGGRVGLFISAASKARFDYIRVYVSQEEAVNIKDKRENDDPVKAALTDVVISLRQTINQQNKELDSLQKLNGQLQKNKEKNEVPAQNLTTLKKEIKTLKDENISLKSKNTTLENENKKLKTFQETVQKNQSGDVVINLTNLLNTEKEKRAEVEKELKALQKKMAEMEKKNNEH